MQLAQQENTDHPRLKMTIHSPAPTRFLRCAVNANFVPLANGQQKLVWPLTMIVIPVRKDISKFSIIDVVFNVVFNLDLFSVFLF